MMSNCYYLGIENTWKFLSMIVFKVKTKCKNTNLEFFPINIQIKREILITLYLLFLQSYIEYHRKCHIQQ